MLGLWHTQWLVVYRFTWYEDTRTGPYTNKKNLNWLCSANCFRQRWNLKNLDTHSTEPVISLLPSHPTVTKVPFRLHGARPTHVRMQKKARFIWRKSLFLVFGFQLCEQHYLLSAEIEYTSAPRSNIQDWWVIHNTKDRMGHLRLLGRTEQPNWSQKSPAAWPCCLLAWQYFWRQSEQQKNGMSHQTTRHVWPIIKSTSATRCI